MVTQVLWAASMTAVAACCGAQNSQPKELFTLCWVHRIK